MFCIDKDHRSKGHAKILSENDESYEIEYFDSPAKERETLIVTKGRIQRVALGTQTRIFHLDEDSGHWSVGRVLDDHNDPDDPHVLVRFINQQDLSLHYDSLFVRCHKPLEDPVDFLANEITETPRYTEARRSFLNSYIKQRAVTHGISALLSSSIELETHQIDVIRKILRDPIQKYLLADEVGLGKTIEAAVVIRQIALDNPGHNIIILTPATLVEQWSTELVTKFGLQALIDISVRVLPYDHQDINSIFTKNIDLLVIDEAHHIADIRDPISVNAYEEISSNLKNIERILLLSATPILRNEVGFLRMLHLIDPVVYDIDDIEGFKLKTNNRNNIAEATSNLDPQNAIFLDSTLDQILIDLPNDVRLKELVSNLQKLLVGLPNEEDPELIRAIRGVKTHLSETYKLNRRILRNRRKTVTGLTPDRTGVEVITVPDQSIAKLTDILENWRIEASLCYDDAPDDSTREHFLTFYWAIVQCLFAEQENLQLELDKRLGQISSKQVDTFENETELINQMKQAFDYEDWIDEKIETLKKELLNSLGEGQKIIVFTSSCDEADLIYENLKGTPRTSVVRHQIFDEDEMPDPDNDWHKFNLDPNTKIIVCDKRAEEGINLQGKNRTVVHFDLPFNPNRIEQRMGRVDRFGSAELNSSYTFLDKDCQFQELYLKVLKDSFKIFNQSVSTLQYLIEEKFSIIREELFINGPESLDELQKNLEGPTGEVAKELKSIDRQDTLDELEPLPEDSLDDLYDIDGDWRGIQNSFNQWACDTLIFEQVYDQESDRASVARPLGATYRFLYKKSRNYGSATLLPLKDYRDFWDAIDPDHGNSEKPCSHSLLSHRQSAVRQNVRPLRYGDSFVEAMKTFSERDDRGRSSAIWRQIVSPISQEITGMYFRFDFLIETDITDPLKFLVDSGITKPKSAKFSLLRRSDGLFRPVVMPIWVNEEGDLIHGDISSEYLDPSYSKETVNQGFRDTNLKSSRLRSLMKKMPNEFDNWSTRCFRMRDAALGHIKKDSALNAAIKTAVKNAKRDDEAKEALLKTRIQLLNGIEAVSEQNQLAIEKRLSNLLYEGIKNPSIKIDATGMTYLTNLKFPNQ